MSGVYSMTGGPTYTGASGGEWMQDALDTPLSLFSTLGQSAKTGVLDSFGLGTFIKDKMLPEEAPTEAGTPRIVPDGEGGFTYKRETPDEMAQRRADMGAMSEDQYKASAFYRQDIPWDAGMTEARAAALAQFDDARKARDYFAQKRPFAAFIGGLGGQAIDPINYIPVFGEAVQGAQVARFGYVGGRLLMGAADAAINTGVASVATAGDRAKFGDDVSWQATISQMATAALLGGAFGALHGAFEGRGARVGATARADAESRLSDLKTTQEARIALNEGIDAIVRGEDVNLSPNATEPLQRITDEITAFHGSPHDFSAFATEHIGSGEGAQAYGRGLYFAENADIAKGYQRKLGVDAALADNPQAGSIVRDLLDANGGDFAKALKQLDREFESDIPGTDNMRNPVYAAAHKFLSQRQPGNLYEVRIAASKDHLLDWDKPLSEQSPYVQEALRKQMGDANFEQFASKTGGEYVEYGLGNTHASDLMNAGIPGIKYLDASSRSAGDGSHNIVVFDQNRVRIARKNDQPLAVDTAKAVPELPPQGVKQAEASIAKPEDARALAAQYGVDANTGAFKEEADITQLADEGRLTEQDVATMAQAHMDYEVADAYAEAIKSVAGCLI